MSMFDITTVGHFSVDFITSPRRRVPKPTLGGPPTYVSLAARRLGSRVSIVSKVGEDFPPRYFAWLSKQGIDLSWVQKVKGAPSTSYLLDYGEDGERRLVLRNRAPRIEAEDIPTSLRAKVIHIAPITNEVSYEAVDRLRRQTGLISLDPQGFLRRFEEDGRTYLEGIEKPEILGVVDIFKASRREIEAVSGKSDLTQAVRSVYSRGPRLVIVTRGAEGALLYMGGEFYRVPAAKPRVVIDPTGAGDVFIGAFLAEYVQRKDPLWCACVGTASASFVVETFGPEGFGSEGEVYERAAQVYEGASLVTDS